MLGSGLTDATREDRSRRAIREVPLCRCPNVCLGNHRGTLLRWKHLNLPFSVSPVIETLCAGLVNDVESTVLK
jgi:hypothetical protein